MHSSNGSNPLPIFSWKESQQAAARRHSHRAMPGAGGGGGALKQPLLPDCGKKEGATTTTPHVAIKVERPSAVAEGVVPIVLETRALNYYLGAGEKGEEKRILKDVSLRFSSGVLTAVMGPSGAGKTTLLNLLTGNAGGRIEGAVEVNGRPLKEVASRFKKLSTTVPQDDTLLSSLTPRETLTFAARLRLPMALTGAEKRQRVAMVLEELSLTRCADQRIGNVDYRGISGGERKRTSIALELLVNPSVMFVDEPTSGLDAKMAQDVVTTLQKLARQGRTLVCTIHQPSFKIFQLFDRLVLLSLGAVTYAGPVRRVEAYFSQLGYDTPHGDNPADYFMRVLQLGPEDEDENGKKGSDLPALWREQGQAFDTEEDGDGGSSNGTAASSSSSAVVVSPAAEASDLKELDLGYSVPRWYQMVVLFQRAFIDGLKDQDKFLGGLILKAAVGLLVGIVWLRQGKAAEQKSIFPITGALFIATTSSVLDTVFGCILTFPSMKALLLREYKNGTYSLLPFYLATLLNAIVFNAFYAVFLATPIFFLVGDPSNAHMLGQPFDAGRYFLFLALLALLATIGAALGLMVGSLVKDVQQGQQACMPTLIPLLLFSGYLIPYEQIPSYFKWLYHCSPFAYAMSALQIVLFRDVSFADCLPPPCPQACYGGRTLCFATGQEYLDSVNAKPSELGRKFGLLVAIFSVFLCGGYVCMSILVRRKTN